MEGGGEPVPVIKLILVRGVSDTVMTYKEQMTMKESRQN